MIEAEDALEAFGASSKLNADWDFLTTLKDVGRDAANNWLDENFDKVGVESTVNLREQFF